MRVTRKYQSLELFMIKANFIFEHHVVSGLCSPLENFLRLQVKIPNAFAVSCDVTIDHNTGNWVS